MKNMTIAISALAIASAASAGVLDLQYLSAGAGLEVNLIEGADSRDIFVGELEHEISNAMGADAALNGIHYTFCVDITQVVSGAAAVEYYTSPIEDMPDAPGIMPMGMVKADAIRALYSSASSTLEAGSLSDEYAAAFQLVIYEIVDDFDGTVASIDLDAGYIQATAVGGGALDAGILAELSNITSGLMTALANGEGSFGGVVGLANATYQDQLVYVPTPGALALLGIGGLAATRRRRS
ncbi:MAG: PEP-CTERM sorting domain-containing protein [Phycisphaerales bacterium]|nr:PEP-CTERM sorting domain-containing protein [Phycisphaerales bacterium]